MNSRASIPSLCCLFICAILSQAYAESLSFDSLTVETTVDPSTPGVLITFPFTNKTSKSISMDGIAAPCSCIEAKFKDDKKVYQPGESGEVTAVFKAGNFFGTVSKQLVVWQKGDDKTRPSAVLTALIHIPELAAIEPKTLNWSTNETVSSKTCRITINQPEEIHVTEVVTTNNHFATQLKTITSGREYEIVVTPKDTAAPNFAILKISTDCNIPRFARIQAFANIR